MRLIDADKLITALEITITKSDADFESEYLNGIKQGIETALEIVKIAPTVEERPQGEWGKWVISEIRCPNCLEYFETDCYSTGELRTCPICGADMEGAKR